MINSFTGKYRFLSNFYGAPVEINDWLFMTSEHAYQAAKSLDPIVWRSVQKDCLTPGQAKRYGSKINLRPDWNQVKLGIMTEIVEVKFEQNPHLMMQLIDTEDQELIEGNVWGDTYWGVCNGKGENHLGKILMQIREQNK